MNGTVYNRVVKGASWTLVSAAVLLSAFYALSMAPRLGIVMGTTQYVNLAAALLLPLAFLLVRVGERPKDSTLPWYDAVAAVLSFAIPIYAFATYTKALTSSWIIFPPALVLTLGIVMSVLVVEAARRTGGKFFVISVVVLALAPFYVHFLPGFLKGNAYTLQRVVGSYFIGSEGIFGSVMKTFILSFLLFIFFGVATQACGAGKFFTNVSLALLGRYRGGAAKAAIVASSLFGTISGSASANVTVCGSFTIPMMKQAGYKPHFAAAVEAASSEGGIIMPPVMGAVAFVMADFLGISYWKVALAAIVPAILYYWCLFSQVHFHALNHGLKAVPRGSVPPLRETLREGWHLVLVAVFLIWLLFVRKVNPGQAALFATVALFAVSFVRKSTRPDAKMMVTLVETSARVFAQLAPIILAIGLIIAGINISGLGMSFTQWLQTISGSSPVLGLVALAIAAFVLGTGMPGVAIYMLLALLMAPTLEGFGLNRLAVHMTILYWGLMADFTPPTAIAPTIAAGYAGASPLATSLQAMRLAAVIYVAPFFFVFHPVILFQHFEVPLFALTVVSAFLGCWLLARAFEGYGPGANWRKQFMRLAVLVSAIGVLSMVWYLQIAGVAMAAGAFLWGRSIDKEALAEGQVRAA
ncbi:MAG: TRAP transporter fused permease subunit [Dehalococcoidia bacterium]|nr:TRAP transporter fused permease subunit [Dehalococcoidia bacterium]